MLIPWRVFLLCMTFKLLVPVVTFATPGTSGASSTAETGEDAGGGATMCLDMGFIWNSKVETLRIRMNRIVYIIYIYICTYKEHVYTVFQYTYAYLICVYRYRYYIYIYIFVGTETYILCMWHGSAGYARTPGSNLSNLFESFPAQDQSGSGLFSDACGAMVCCGHRLQICELLG